MENTETTIVENNFEVISQPAKKKSNKKVIILAAVIAVVVIGIVAAVIAIVGGNSNSLWSPLEGKRWYGYNMTPDEFVAKVNECDFGVEDYEFDEINPNDIVYDYDVYMYTADFSGINNSSYLFIDYYPDDNIIENFQITVPFNDSNPYSMKSYKNVRVQMGELAVQMLYAYNAFGKNASEDDMIDVADKLEVLFGDAIENQPNHYIYDDFHIVLSNTHNSDGNSGFVAMSIVRVTEDRLDEIKQNGANVIALTDDISSNDDTDEITTKKTETTTKEVKKAPKDCFVSTKEIYEKAKPFFVKYGYDIDSWNVISDDDESFIAETSSEAIVLGDGSLDINLAKGQNLTRGLQVYTNGNSANNIQLWFDGGEQDKAYELLDVIFDGAVVDDKTLSEYIQNEYSSHLNSSNVSNWTNGGIRYTIQFNNDLTLISLYLS